MASSKNKKVNMQELARVISGGGKVEMLPQVKSDDGENAKLVLDNLKSMMDQQHSINAIQQQKLIDALNQIASISGGQPIDMSPIVAAIQQQNKMMEQMQQLVKVISKSKPVVQPASPSAVTITPNAQAYRFEIQRNNGRITSMTATPTTGN